MITLLSCFKNTILILVLLSFSCGNTSNRKTPSSSTNKETSNKTKLENKDLIIGANRVYAYLPLLKNKRVGIVANQTSVIFKPKSHTHLVDSLLKLGVNIKKVFAPEHGFRGKADAGEVVKNGIDIKTNLPIISLYGKNKKPTDNQLKDLDVIVFDIQDVGARFYTYISSLHYVMEACAENNVELIVLDRPNPNGHIIDGPILEPEFKSFVGMHEIPVLHGMTIGEYAQMINGENWLQNNSKCNLSVIKMAYYNHNMPYSLPIKPSPNLPNDLAINLYPSLCFFEGTNVSVGRGTNKQFQVYGAPFFPEMDFSYTPKPNEGAKYPKHEGLVCYGYNLSNRSKLNHLELNFLVNAYKLSSDKNSFFLTNGFFTKLAGTKKLQEQIVSGLSPKEIKATWEEGLKNFKITRNKYLLYN